MYYNFDDYRKSYTNINDMLAGIPAELHYLFLPEDPNDLIDLEAAIIALKKRAVEREQVLSLQQLCGLPLRPNASLRATRAKARLQGLKYRRLYDRKRGGSNDGERLH